MEPLSVQHCEFELKRDLDLAEIQYKCLLSHAKVHSSILRFSSHGD
jgi:hypothetical protein